MRAKKQKDLVPVFSTGEVENKPFDELGHLVAIVGDQLNPTPVVLAAVAKERAEKIDAEDIPLTFSAIVESPDSEKVEAETKEEMLDDIPPPSLEIAIFDETAIKEKIQATRKWSEDAGNTIITCEEGLRKLDELEADPDSVLSATTLRKQRDIFERKLREINGYSNRAAVQHAIFSAILTRFRKANSPDEGLEAIEKAEAQGRFLRPSEAVKREVRTKNNGKWPDGAIFFPYENEVVVFFSNRGENGSKPSDGQKALEAEARNMAKRVELNHATQMAKKGQRNLIRLKKGLPGVYYDHCRKGKDEKTGKTRLAGDLLLEVFDKNDHGDEEKRTQSPFIIIKIIEATGSFSWLVRSMAKVGLDYIPHYWLERGVSEKLDEAKQKAAWNVVNCLKARIYAWENSLKPASEAPKA